MRPIGPTRRPGRTGSTVLATLGCLYLTLLLGWVICRFAFEDRWWWLVLLNSFAVYLFVPLPGLMLVLPFVRRRAVGLGGLIALLLAAHLFGGLFLPRDGKAQAALNTVTVMTYNVLGSNERSNDVVDAIRSAGADVVALQELSPVVAQAIREGLTGDFPYQILEPRQGVTGLGVIARFSLRPTGDALAGAWIGAPQVLAMDVHGTEVVLINAHAVSMSIQGANWPERMEAAAREREQQMKTLTDFVRARPEPVLAVGDFNMTDQHRAYRTVTQSLGDAWREVGFGLGHTFPGQAPGPLRRHSVAAPAGLRWLVRIDYVFHSDRWRALSASTGPWDRTSDHRPVVADLMLLDD